MEKCRPCSGYTKEGLPCSRPASCRVGHKDYCWQHAKSKAGNTVKSTVALQKSPRKRKALSPVNLKTESKKIKLVTKASFSKYEARDPKLMENDQSLKVIQYEDNGQGDSRPDWLKVVSESLTAKVHISDITRKHMLNFFNRFAKRLKALPDGTVRFAVKGSTPLKLWFDKNIDRLPGDLAVRYKKFSEKYLKSSDWDSDLVINPLLNAEEIRLIRNIVDQFILKEMSTLKREMEADDELIKMLTKVRLSEAQLGEMKDIAITKRWSNSISRTSKDIEFRELKSYSPLQLGIRDIKKDYQPEDEELLQDTDTKILKDLERSRKDIPVTPKSNFYISRNTTIRDGGGFDLYRLQVAYVGERDPSKSKNRNGENKKAFWFSKAELIDIGISVPRKDRDKSWSKYKEVFKLGNFNMLHPSVQIRDLQHMVDDAMTKEGSKGGAFKLGKRLKRLKFLKRLECHLGKNLDFAHLLETIPKGATPDQIEDHFLLKEQQFENYCKELKVESKGECSSRHKSQILTSIGKNIYDKAMKWERQIGEKKAFNLLFASGLFSITPASKDSFAKYTHNLYIFFSKTELCHIEKKVIEMNGFQETLEWMRETIRRKREGVTNTEIGFLEEI